MIIAARNVVFAAVMTAASVSTGCAGGGSLTTPAQAEAAAFSVLSVARPNTRCPNNDGIVGDIVRRTTPLCPPRGQLWCWAASGEMAMNYLEPNVLHEQCVQANQALGRYDCCNFPRPAACNQAGGGIPPLREFSSAMSAGALNDSQIFHEICEAKRPFLIILPASGGGSHMMTVVGYDQDPGGDLLIVHDPWTYGKVKVDAIAVDDYRNRHTANDHDLYRIKKGAQ